MDQSGAPLAVSLSCDINTGKNQSDCTNCLKCLRIENKSQEISESTLMGNFSHVMLNNTYM